MRGSVPVTVGELADALAERFPLAWAEPWDAVGLRVGSREAPATSVYVTLDADVSAVRSAAAHGCNVLLTHHPPFLGEISAITDASSAGSLVLVAAAAGVAVIAMHTNLDRAPEAADALPLRLGLRPEAPLESSTAEVDVVTTFVPVEARDRVVDAMTAAGAGRIGQYAGCVFSARGEGGFVPLGSARPAVGEGATAVPEERIEMVAPGGMGSAVAVAARSVHPYEEPVVLVTRTALSRGAARLGRMCTVESQTLAALAQAVGAALGVRPRVWGGPETVITRVAVANGSGGSLVHEAVGLGAQALVTGEVRYHDAVAARARGLALIEAGHDATEWPLTDILAGAVAAVLGEERVVRAEAERAWWTVEGA